MKFVGHLSQLRNKIITMEEGHFFHMIQLRNQKMIMEEGHFFDIFFTLQLRNQKMMREALQEATPITFNTR